MTRSLVSKVSCSIRSRSLAVCGATLVWLAIQGPLAADGVMITEFVARNLSTLADEDGDFPDWIEIYNGFV